MLSYSVVFIKKTNVKLVSAIFLKLQQQTMSTCVRTPRKPKLYVAMVDASFTFCFRLSEASSFRRKKISMRNKLNDV